METMTKLEREQSNKLLELDDTIDRMFSRENELQDKIQQLHSENERLQSEYDKAAKLLSECLGEKQKAQQQLAAATRERDEAKRDLQAVAECMEAHNVLSCSNDMPLCDEIICGIGNLVKRAEAAEASIITMKCEVQNG